MPREHRKRGKKHKTKAHDQHVEVETSHHAPTKDAQQEPENGPSWIVSHSNTSDVNAEAPFGYVDSEVKAYFRTVDSQIREWQDTGRNMNEEGNMDPNEGALLDARPLPVITIC